MPNPIKVNADMPIPYRFIEWMITDLCNYDCSFCSNDSKKGYRGRLDLETNKKIVDAIADLCAGSPYYIQLTGGEPTLYPDFIELVQYMKQKGAIVNLISNGSRTLRWWEELRDAHLIDNLYITFHSQQKADYKHIKDVINLFHKEHTSSLVLATYIKESIDYVLEGCDYIKANTGAHICINAMTIHPDFIDSIKETGKYERIREYTWAAGNLHGSKTRSKLPYQITRTPILTVTYDDGTTESGIATYLTKLGKNKFLGWDCDIGLTTMKIEIDKIYRGGCRADGKEFSIENIKFWETPVICAKLQCNCGTDMFYTKRKRIPIIAESSNT